MGYIYADWLKLFNNNSEYVEIIILPPQPDFFTLGNFNSVLLLMCSSLSIVSVYKMGCTLYLWLEGVTLSGGKTVTGAL